MPSVKGVLAFSGAHYRVLQALDAARVVQLMEESNGSYFYRVGFRRAPHNLYTNTSLLWSLTKRKGEYKKTHLPSLGFKDEEKGAANPVERIEIGFGSVTRVRWQYDRQRNAYLRFQEGAPHTDRVTGRQLAARNVIVMRVAEKVLPYGEDVVGTKALEHDLIGTGKAIFFIDGKRINGKWTWGKARAPVFTDASGQKVLLNRGLVWIELAVPRNTVTIE